MSKVIITGVNGFVGQHLAHEMHAQGHEVIGVGRDQTVDESLESMLSNYYSCDLTDEPSVAAIPLDSVDAVISLAGLAKFGESFDKPELYRRVNVSVFSVLAERLLALNSKARIVAVSSGTVYDTAQDMPLREDSRIITSGSPYSLSKIAMEDAARELRKKGLDCVIVRPFNHIGPGQEDGFLIPDLYRKIQECRKSKQPLRLGDLSTRRDYTDVRDVVKAYAALALAGSLKYDLYNVCSGRSIEGKKIFDLLLKEVGPVGVKIQSDPTVFRPNDSRELLGDNERLRTETQWQLTIILEQTIHDFVASRENNT